LQETATLFCFPFARNLHAFLGYDLEYLGLDLENLTKNTFGIAIAVYFLGHVAQAASSKMFTPKKDFSSSQKSILNDVRSHFSIASYSDQEAFQVCYLWACGADKTGHIAEMNAKFGLYRGWGFVLILQSAFYIYALINDFVNDQLNQAIIIGLLFTVLLAVLMVRRARKFYFILGAKTLQTFIVNKHPI
jgi:hypothetical protein